MEFILFFVVGLGILLAFNVGLAFDIYKLWVKEKTILLSFPSWKDTNKPKIWWCVWTFLAFTDIIPYVIGALVYFRNIYFCFMGALIIAFFYLIVGAILYFIVKNILKNKENK